MLLLNVRNQSLLKSKHCEIYRRDLKEQWQTFIYAYFYKNNLLAPSDPDKEYSDDYEERALKAVLMSQFIDKKEIHKMIEQ